MDHSKETFSAEIDKVSPGIVVVLTLERKAKKEKHSCEEEKENKERHSREGDEEKEAEQQEKEQPVKYKIIQFK